jgi:hypothetical protein
VEDPGEGRWEKKNPERGLAALPGGFRGDRDGHATGGKCGCAGGILIMTGTVTPLVLGRVGGGFGEDAMEGGEIAEGVDPEVLVVGVAEELGRGRGGDPGVAFDFCFELAFGPSGVADEGADEGAGVAGVFDGVVRGEPGGEAEAFFFGPPEGGEGEVLAGDGAADVHGDAGEGDEFFVVQEVADLVAGGLVENEAEGAIDFVVIGDEDDGAVEDAIGEAGGSEEEFSLQSQRGFL